MEILPTRSYSIDDKKISIYDGLISKKESLALDNAFRNAPFMKKEVATPETAKTPHWALNLSLDEYKSTPLHKATIRAVEHFTQGKEKYRPYRHYCNQVSFGDFLFSHRDCNEAHSEVTALWFISKQWSKEWGGETLFFNESGDAEFVSSPIPGRLVLFDSNIIHAGRTPSRSCTDPRFTFAIKLEKY